MDGGRGTERAIVLRLPSGYKHFLHGSTRLSPVVQCEFKLHALWGYAIMLAVTTGLTFFS